MHTDKIKPGMRVRATNTFFGITIPALPHFVNNIPRGFTIVENMTGTINGPVLGKADILDVSFKCDECREHGPLRVEAHIGCVEVLPDES